MGGNNRAGQGRVEGLGRRERTTLRTFILSSSADKDNEDPFILFCTISLLFSFLFSLVSCLFFAFLYSLIEFSAFF